MNKNAKKLPARAAAELAALIEKTAKGLGFKSTEAQQSDREDFREIAVWNVAQIVREAFEAGRASK